MAVTIKRLTRRVSALRQLWMFRDTLIIIATPLILLPVILMNPSSESKCGYVLLLMGVYWVTGALPMAITSLLPMIFFPLMGLEKAGTLSTLYIKNGSFILIGGIILALSIEKWNLHKRVALRVLLLIGSRPRWLLLGFILTSGFLSMWISNTATATMMIPIAKAITEEINTEKTPGTDNENKMVDNEECIVDAGDDDLDDEKKEVSYRPPNKNKFDKVRFGKGLIICTAYSASLGGTATLTGRVSNVVMKGQADILFGEESGLNFVSWFVFACPVSLLCLLLAWVWLQIYYLGFRRTFCACAHSDEPEDDNGAAVKSMLQREYQKLGEMTFAEWTVTISFVCLVILWLTRQPGFCPGWGSLFTSPVSDSLPCVLVAILLFFLPSSKPAWPFGKPSSDLAKPRAPLLDWRHVETKFPWSIIFLLGGGFALASVCKTSGLSVWLAMKLSVLRGVPLWVASVVIGGVVSLATEISSNIAVTSVFAPVMADMGVALGVNPLYFMLLAVISSAFAFVLPVATPPNTIAYAYGNLKIKDMAAPGLVLNAICVSVLVLGINTWGVSYMNLGEFPKWAEAYKLRLANGTSAYDLSIISANNSSLCFTSPL